MPYRSIRALTLDLDDTLWPVAPVIAAAELRLRGWLELHAPATAARFDAQGLRGVRDGVARDYPHLAHDLSELRLLSLRRAIELAAEPAHLADQAFEVFFIARQQVEFYPEVLEALERLAVRYPLFALSNGNADLQRVGLGHLFRGAISAREVGCSKPDRRIFDAACRRVGCEPAAVLHVGDDFELDVRGARSAGMAAIWLRRSAALDPQSDHDESIADLQQLVLRLGC